MMMQQQKVQQNNIQRKTMTTKNYMHWSADRTGMHGVQPRYYNTGSDSSIYDNAFCRTGTSAYPQAPEYTVDAAPLRTRDYNTLSPKTIQRVVSIQKRQLTALPADIRSSIDEYVQNNRPLDANNKQFKKKINNHIQNMIIDKQKYPDFENNMELIAYVISNKLTPASRSGADNTHAIGDYLSRLYTQICKDIESIFLMTPSVFEQYMIRHLLPTFSIRDATPTDSPENGMHYIIRNYQSSKSSIAGTITYQYMREPFNFFIEIHPKGGIHYGAYFLMEYSCGRKSAVKFIRSKSLTYLPLNEKQREARFMHDNIPADVMTSILAIGNSPRQKGPATSPTILQIPIAQIFRKKGMTAAGIWSEQTRASVEEQRDAIRKIRIKKLDSLPVDARILHIQYELLLIEKQLLSLERELIAAASPTPERTSSIGNALKRIGTSLDSLDALIRNISFP